MNNKNLVAAVAKRTGESKASVKRTIDVFMNEVLFALQTEEKVELYRFGKFYKYERAAYTGRNPKTGGAVPVKESTTLRFKASKAADIFAAK